MKLFARLFLMSAIMVAGFNISQAEGVTDVRVEATNDYVSIFWDALSSSDFAGSEGYALQFNDRQNEVTITKPANLFFRPNETSVSLRRNSFNNNTYYYTRVYSYGVDDETNDKIKANGSVLLKWKVDFWNNIETTETIVNDPVIATSSSSTTDKNDLFDFGELRSTAFDTFLNLSWSKPVLMAESDFDGFFLTISENSDLSDPILEKTYDREDTQTRIKGLTPNTQYYVRASFYERTGGQTVTFGNDDIKEIKTLVAIPRDGSTRAARNIAKIETQFYGVNAVVDGGTVSTTTAAPTVTAPAATTTPTITTTNTASSNTSILARITQLKAQISSLQSELRTLEAQAGVSSSTSTTTSTRTTTTTSSNSSSGNSRLSKIKELLEARRNGR